MQIDKQERVSLSLTCAILCLLVTAYLPAGFGAMFKPEGVSMIASIRGQPCSNLREG
jgi:hypothetical protein